MENNYNHQFMLIFIYSFSHTIVMALLTVFVSLRSSPDLAWIIAPVCFFQLSYAFIAPRLAAWANATYNFEYQSHRADSLVAFQNFIFDSSIRTLRNVWTFSIILEFTVFAVFLFTFIFSFKGS